jgi:predicted nucleic acid-binding protein
MTLRIAVVDSSPLINLTHLNLAPDLTLFFDRVYVPRAVQEELNKKGRFRYRLNKLYRSRFFVKCMAADAFNVRLLRDQLDRGEAEALIQAQEKQALFFIGDERRARAIATSMGRRAVGTLRLLARLNLEGRAPELSGLVKILRRDLDFRASDEIVQHAIDLAVEAI